MQKELHLMTDNVLRPEQTHNENQCDLLNRKLILSSQIWLAK